MSLEVITTPHGDIPLGCLVPTTFPTATKTFADLTGGSLYTLDQIRAGLAGKGWMWARRQRFAGTRYVRNQRNYGSCNGWSTAGVLSRMRELRGEPYVCLSGADAYSQMNGGQDNGSMLADGLKIVEANGIAPEELVPWNKIYTSQISAEAKAARARFKGFKAYPVDEEVELANALYLGYFAVIAVHATDAFMSEDGDGINRGGNGVGNHSVLLQDVGALSDGTLKYDMGNSWDVDFCDGGYTSLTWNRHLRQTVQNHRFWILVSTTDDDKDSSVPPKVKE